MLYDPQGNAIPLVSEILISIDCQKAHVEMAFTQIAGVLFHSPRVEECVELDLEFREDMRVKSLRKSSL